MTRSAATSALPDGINDKGELVFHSGSTLAPVLSLPRIRKSLATSPDPVTVRPGDPWHQATAATERLVNTGTIVSAGSVGAAGLSLDSPTEATH